MATVMKLKTLQSYLQDLKGFNTPKVQLEQYITPPHIAAIALYTIQTQFEALESRMVLDAGCGPGNLAIGAALLGAGAVTAVDIDGDVMQVFKENVDELVLPNVDAVLCDFNSIMKTYRWGNYFDTVIMNPPFGTKNNVGTDMRFLQMAIHLSSDNVFSLHKSTTRSFIQKKIKNWGIVGSVIAELRYDLPQTYKFHKERSRDIAVDLWRFHHPC